MTELQDLYINYLNTHDQTFTAALANTTDPQILNAQNTDGNTLLHLAAIHQDIDTVRILLEKGVNVKLKNNFEQTALWQCVMQTPLNIPLIGLLIIHGANIDDTNAYGQTALYQAVFKGDEKKVEQLLRLGANACATDYVIVNVVYTPLREALIVASARNQINNTSNITRETRMAIVRLLLKHTPVIIQDFTQLSVPEEYLNNIIVIGSIKFLKDTNDLYGPNDEVKKTASANSAPSLETSTQNILATLNQQKTEQTAVPALSVSEHIKELRQIIAEQDEENPYVHRRMKGFKQAITNVEEFEEAKRNGIKFDYKAIERATAGSEDVEVRALHAKAKELLDQEELANKDKKMSPEPNLQKYVVHFIAEHSIFPSPQNPGAEKYKFHNLTPDLLEQIEEEELRIIQERRPKKP